MEYLAYGLGGLTVLAALLVVFNPHPVRSVLWLVVTFFLISAQYVLMNAQFVAVVNIIVYAGAIMVLFLFVLMLLNLSRDTEPQKSVGIKFAAVASAGMLLIVMVAALKDSSLMVTQDVTLESANQGLTENLGRLLFTKYVVPFEVSSILFIAAMVGAVLLGKREKQSQNS
ncbi:MAG TPA: NADH-quinone oxidoreductase subunit J [Flavobacteriales bacterium]|nr:NADH-quinone oxidoreductase subunit J [Flavobacteriales bacterium]